MALNEKINEKKMIELQEIREEDRKLSFLQTKIRQYLKESNLQEDTVDKIILTMIQERVHEPIIITCILMDDDIDWFGNLISEYHTNNPNSERISNIQASLIRDNIFQCLIDNHCNIPKSEIDHQNYSVNELTEKRELLKQECISKNHDKISSQYIRKIEPHINFIPKSISFFPNDTKKTIDSYIGHDDNTLELNSINSP